MVRLEIATMGARDRARRRVVDRLLRSPEPSVRWRTRVRVLGEPRSSPSVRRLEEEVRRSRRVRLLLTHRRARYVEGTARGLYHYWQGLHWALASLADMGYPPGDPDLGPLIDRALRFWTQPRYDRLIPQGEGESRTAGDGVLVIAGRPRRCASIQGNALLYATVLGVEDERTDHLARLLLRWQWPDGGWNCDRRPRADTSSFMETLCTMRGLAAHADASGSASARRAARRAAEVFLRRRLYRRVSDGRIMKPDFVRLHYPLYWHYDVLGGLKGLAEVGRISDSRSSAALDWLEGRELPDGGWPVDSRYYRVSRTFQGSAEFVDWGSPSRGRMNPWVTTDALAALAASGRFSA
jgi:hypothetical protein